MPLVHLNSGAILADNLEQMTTPQARARGLLKFDSAPFRYAAIFHLPWAGFFPLVHCVGMKFSIDLMFCDASKRVLMTRWNVKPGQWVMPWAHFFGGARYLVECSGCEDVSKLVKSGDRLDWSFSK